MPRPFIISRISLLALLLVSPLARGAGVPIPPVEFQKETLPNGLKVIYAPMRQAPVVHVRVLYHVGSRDERPDRQGFAHMFEHMMFRGSAHVQPEQHMKMINLVGGNSNAFTSFDQTTYINTIPANAVEMALYLEADRMASFKVNDTIFQTERKVVAEEWRMRYGNQPLGMMMLDLLKTGFTTHSYRWTAIGDMDQLRQSMSSELQQFFNTYYVPNNACLIIAGDVDIPRTKEWVNKYFGWIPKGQNVPRSIPAEPEQTETKRLIVYKPNVPLTNIYMGFKTTDYASDDHYALYMLGDILASGRTGRLDRKFVTGADPACVGVGAGDYQLQDQALFVCDAVVQQGKDPDQVEKDFLATVYETLEKGVTQEELDKVRTQWRQSLIRGRQTCTAIAAELGEEEVFGGDANRVNQHLAKMDALTPADITAVGKKYLKPERLTVVHYRPDPTGINARRAEAASKIDEVKNAPVVASTDAIEPRIKGFPTGYPTEAPFNPQPIQANFNKGTEKMVDGVRVITVTDKRLPLVNISLVMPGGSDSEPLTKVGLGGITAQMMSRGSAGMSFLDFSSDLEAKGISISPVDAGDTTRLAVSCTTDQLDHAVMRANQLLTSPNFPQEEFNKLMKQHMDGLTASLAEPATVADRELIQAMYPGTTLGRVTTHKTLQAQSLDEVKKWYEQFYQLEGAFLLVSGDIEPAASEQIAKKLLAGFTRRKAPPAADYSKGPAPTALKILLVDNPEGKQSTIRMSVRAYDVQNQEKFAGTIAGQILSAGIESRLMRYVRAEKGLAYGCRAYFQPSRHAGDFSGTVDTNPDTTAEAIQAMLKVFTDMKTADVTAQELTEAKGRIAGGMVIETQTIAQQAGRRQDQILNGYPLDYWDVYPQKIAQVQAGEIRTVMNKYVKEANLIVVVVGPASVVKPQLEKLGTVEVVPMPLKRAS